MDLQLTDEQKAIQEALRDIALAEIRPVAREAEESGQVPERIEKQLFEMGVAAPVSEDFGGQGVFDAVTSVVVAEEIAWGDPGTAYYVLGRGLGATLIDLAGTEAQRKELLPQIAEGAAFGLALAERDAGADVTQLEAEVADGRLTGLKYAVPFADGDSLMLVAARQNDAPALFLIDPSQSDLKPEDKLGLRSARTAKIKFDKLAVTEQIGEAGESADLHFAFLRAKLLNAGVALGLAKAALEYATKYAQERTAFGRPIGAFQAISFKIADRAMDLESARLLVWKAAWAVDNKLDQAERLVMSACGHAVAAAVATADDGVQILGGHGYMRDHPEELWYRDALTLATFDSPSMVGDLFMSADYKVGSR
ncbi:MAG TPA: acyl-CoA dehydrogenase family protein [Actinomycetota bacterium]|nr:acyl-CoA dehydrogenase family protein [Actinomycetota bacterium]